MNICEATKQAFEQGRKIARSDDESFVYGEMKIEPTNTPDCCRLTDIYNQIPCRGWQPQAEDLMSENWIVVD